MSIPVSQTSPYLVIAEGNSTLTGSLNLCILFYLYTAHKFNKNYCVCVSKKIIDLPKTKARVCN